MKDADAYSVDCAPVHLHVRFNGLRRVISSAVLNGGLVHAAHIVNLHVPQHIEPRQPFDPPEVALIDYCRRMGWEAPAVGMMTAAPMSSLRRAVRREGDVEVAALVTAGLSNARRVGDPAEWRTLEDVPPMPHTINIIVGTNAQLTDAALVEAVQMVTEVKVALLQDLQIVSAATGRPATGTGTDCVAVFSGLGPPRIRYCGKHVLFGEMLAGAVMEALGESLKGERNAAKT
jgi:adenosylcobinamide amidohydrolase